MWLSHWLAKVYSAMGVLPNRLRQRRRPASAQIESLEERVLLANWVGDIPNGTVWPAGQIQRIAGDIHIPSGSTLTIQPGAIIKFDSYTYDVTVDGTLLAQGTAGSPIVFTEIRDDIGGDTNGNGANSGPSSGNWGRIEFKAGSTGSILDYVDVRYGGFGSAGEIYVNGGQLTLTNSSIRNSSSSGVRIETGNPTLTGNTYLNNTVAAVSMDLASSPLISGVTVTNNGVNGLVLDTGTLVGNRSWNDPDITYWFTDDITVPQGSTLTIAAGQVIKRPYYGDLFVNGSLVANGTTVSPIVFTEQRDDTAGGDTNNNAANSGPGSGNSGVIQFSSTSSGNVMDHVEVRYAGYGNPAAVVVDAAPLTFSNGVIRSSSNAGLRIVSSNPVISGSSFTGNALGALSMDLGSNPNISGNTTSGNGVNGITLDSGALVANLAWNDPDITYWFTDDITVPAGKTLTIAAGQVIKRPYFGDLFVNGSLVANGTTQAPIIFTEQRDDTAGGDTNSNGNASSPSNGNAGVIQFSGTSSGNVMDHVEIRYAGYGNPAAVVVDTAPLTFTNGVIRNSANAGLRIKASNPVVSGSTFTGNSLGALSMDLASNPNISGNTISGNGVNGLVLDTGSLVVDLAWNDPDVTYWFTDDITVPAGRTLTIAAGQVIKRPYFGDLYVNGSLVADGTALAPIIFTEQRDDAAGGDTNSNGNASGPGSGNAGVIQFSSTSTGNVMDHVEVRYAGYGNPAAVVVDTAPLAFTNGVIRNSANAGLRFKSSNAIVSGSAFADNTLGALSMDLASNPAISGNTLTGNGVNGLVLDSGSLVGNGIWDDPDIVYWFTDDITVPAGQTLTIEPGQIIKRPYFGDLFVNGSLLANGLAAAPIVFTEQRDDTAGGDTNNNLGNSSPGPGNAGVVRFSNTSTASVMNHVDMRYGGFNYPASLVVDGAPLNLTNSIVRQSATHAVQAQGTATLNILNSLLVSNNDQGLRAESGATVTAINNTIDGNFRGAVVDGANTVLSLTNNLITNNTRSGITVSGRGIAIVGYNDVFNPGASDGNYQGMPVATGSNGNVSVDPKYVDRTTRDFHLQATSPVIDAATSNTAPVDDFDFNFRVDTPAAPNTGNGASPFFDMGALEFGGRPRAVSHTPDSDVGDVVSAVVFSFRGAMNTASFNIGADVVSFTGPTGPLSVTGFEWLNPFQLQVTFAPQAKAGDYQLVLGPNILTAAGSPLDTDGDGTAGENLDDRYAAAWKIVPPRIIQQSPQDYFAPPLDHLDFTFDRPMDQQSFTLGDIVSFEGPDGSLTATGFSWLNPRTLRVSFASQTTLGAYEMVLGTNIADLGGNYLDQSGNGVAGELPVDRYVAEFTLANIFFVSGNITQNTTWSGLIIVDDNVTVQAGVTLTINPGTIIKLHDLTTIFVQSGGTLLSNGTTAQPVRFTSIHDDSFGGDSDQNDDRVQPQPGDWISLQIDGGTANFEATQIRYGGGSVSGTWSQSGMIRTTGNATLTISRSVLSDAFFDGILAQGGTATITNSIVAGADRGIVSWLSGAHVVVTNSTIVDNRTGLLGHGGTLNVVNSIVSHNLQYGIDNDISPAPTVSSTDIFTPGGTNTRGFTNPIGANGNVSVDPQFKDLERQNYHLDFVSPVIDAANGTSAPTTDLAGSPRYDDPRSANKGTATASGAFADMGALEFVETAVSDIDMVVSGVSGPVSTTVGDLVTIQWTVVNTGTAPLRGPWHDTISLLRNPTAPGDAVTVAEVLVGSGITLGPGQSFTASAQVQVPGVVSGSHYWQVSTNTKRDIFEGSNVSNNSTLSVTQVSVNLTELPIGGPGLSGIFSGTGDAHWYQIWPEAGQDLRLILDSATTTGAVELFVGQGYMPTPEHFDFHQSERNSPDASLVIPSTAAQPYYVLALAKSLSGAATPFTISAAALAFGVSSVSPSMIGDAGPVTVLIQGGQLTEDAVYELVDPSNQAVAASSIQWVNSSTVYATFNLAGHGPGAYDVRIGGQGSPAVLRDAVQVISGSPGKVEVNVVTPLAIRINRTGTLIVEYENTGNTDVVAPLIRLSVDVGNLIGAGGELLKTITLLGISHTGPAGILAPGERGTATFRYKAPSAISTTSVEVALVADSTNQINWAALSDGMRPPTVPSDAWAAIFANFTAAVGNTGASVNAALAANATALSKIGVYTGDVARLTNFELAKAGMDLISSRYELGAFGRGQPTPWETSATYDSTDSSVTIEGPNGLRRFEFNSSTGQFNPAPGNEGQLTVQQSGYRLTETTGEVLQFRSDGKIAYQEFPGGLRTTYNYTGARVTGITDPQGNVTQIQYNAQNRVSSITEPNGSVTTYAYDVSGEHLITIGAASGTTQLGYVTGQGAAREHALASVTFPDGTHLFLEYDLQGRLIKYYRDGQSELIRYTYGADGSITATDANNAQTTVSSGELGIRGIVTGTLGQTTRVTFDSNGNITGITGSQGESVSAAYDENGQLTRYTDATGGVYELQYGTAFNRLTSMTDAAGNVTQFQYDSNGLLSAEVFPDGSRVQYVNGAEGTLAGVTNRRNEVTSYSYDNNGRITLTSYSDGSSTAYGYDSKWNVTSMTDASGTTTFLYDAANRMTRITYPNGRFVNYNYDGTGRRARLSDSSGFAENYQYDAVGRLARVADDANNTIVAYTYDVAGQLLRKDLGNGNYTTYASDLVGGSLNVVNRAPNGDVISQYNYIYDESGHATHVATLDGNWSYQYDLNGQLTRAVFASTNLAIPSQDLTYVYDAVGNRIKTIENGATVAYTTNNLNAYTQAGSTSYAYDAGGNLISKTDATGTWNYEYDVRDRLRSVTHGTDTWTYAYDVLGSRISSTLNGVTTSYLVDPLSADGSVVAEFDHAGTLTAHYARGLNLASRIAANGSAAYYQYDGNGNTSELTGAGGAVLNEYLYLPFGQSLAKNEQVANPFQFVGSAGVMTETNGLTFMRARYFDPQSGRFTQPDPVGLLGGDTNLYRYVNNDPVNLRDPAGLNSLPASNDEAPPNFKVPPNYMEQFVNSARREHIKQQNDQLQSLAGRNEDDATTLSIIRMALKEAKGDYSLALGLVIKWREMNEKKWVADPNFAAADHYLQARTTVTEAPVSTTLIGGWAPPAYYVIKKGLWLAKPVIGVVNNGFSARGESWNAGSQPSLHQLKWAELGLSPWKTDKIKSFEDTSSIDPNEIIGPAGVGASHWISPDETLPFTILFENKSSATAAAQEVEVTHTLPADLDWSTFEITGFGFNNQNFEVPEGRQDYSVLTTLPGDPNPVRVTITLNPVTGLVTWNMRSEDPVTHEFPEDPFAGFLPPNDATHRGEGFVSFIIRAKTNLATGTALLNQADIVFDDNPVIATNVAMNTIDNGAASSAVVTLPALSSNAFLVTWAGTDDAGGSGVANFDVYVSDNNGPYTLWQAGTTATSATYIGTAGNTYRFYTVAHDNVGNTEIAPGAPDATTTIEVNTAPAIPSGQSFMVAGNAANGANVGSVTATDSNVTAPNNTKSYSISSGNGVFNIDPVTGQITVADAVALTAVAGTVATLQITVTDGGTPGLTATQSVAITVSDVNTAPVLANPGPAPTFIGKAKTPVKVFPTLSVTDVNSSTSLASVVISLPQGGAKKNLDIVTLPGLAALGKQTEAVVSGRLQITIILQEGVTNAAVQTMLQGLTFQTKGAGLKITSRNFQVRVTDRTGLQSNTVTQTVTVRKK